MTKTPKNWSENTQELTKRMLLDLSLFSPAYCMKHIDDKYGYIKIGDAAAHNYRVYIKGAQGEDTGEVEDFGSDIMALLEAGWAID